MKKECKFCDQCGKQMTVFDSDGEAIHNGIEVKGELRISYTEKNNHGVSSGPVFNTNSTDICSPECLAKRFAPLIKYVGA